MRIPGAVGQAVLVPEDAHEPTACLDEAAGDEGRLAEESHAVLLAYSTRLAPKVERPVQPAGGEQGEGHTSVAVEVARGFAGVEPPLGIVQSSQQRTAAVDAIQGQVSVGGGRCRHRHRLGRLRISLVRRSGFRRHNFLWRMADSG